jgi:hypothetical protein
MDKLVLSFLLQLYQLIEYLISFFLNELQNRVAKWSFVVMLIPCDHSAVSISISPTNRYDILRMMMIEIFFLTICDRIDQMPTLLQHVFYPKSKLMEIRFMSNTQDLEIGHALISHQSSL